MTDKKIVRARRQLPPGVARDDEKKATRGRPPEPEASHITGLKQLRGFKLSDETLRAIDILKPHFKDIADCAQSHYMLKSNPPRSRNTTGEAPASLIVEIAVLNLLSRFDSAADQDKFLRQIYRIADRQFLAAETSDEIGGP